MADDTRKEGETLTQLAERIGWDAFCDLMEATSPPLRKFLETWGSYCGAPRSVFRGQLCRMLIEHIATEDTLDEQTGPHKP